MNNTRIRFLILIILLLEASSAHILLGQVPIKPLRLNQGDTIGLIAPGWLITEKQLKESIEQITQLGFVPIYTKRILGKNGYFSGTDEQRASDLNEMFLNPQVKGIICANGGYGCTRILDLIDYQVIKENPKIIVGFSDITALLNAIHQKTNLITFHGPISRTIKYDYSASQFKKVVMNTKKKLIIENCTEDLEKSTDKSEYNRYTIASGNAIGELVGGNLTIITSMIGTDYQLDFTDKIVFLEDIGEEPYRIDRMLTQLIETGELQKASGIVLGIFRGCEKSDKSKAPNSFSLQEVIEERIKPLNIPAVYGLSFGHNKNNFTIPIGIKTKLDADKMTIELLENAVK
ncbi:MAG: LD-carboxypeptidase [Bacteroidales bacterium]|nr:LD-carboxypeptidase [Bacteroidales bacterium]